MEQNRDFDLLKAFGYVKRVVESEFFFSEKTYFTSFERKEKLATILYKNHGSPIVLPRRCRYKDSF